jgi:2-polyprenyl-3-methyl-5-hydroxy-6-metoxy-1,4-benzoquinol methylase
MNYFKKDLKLDKNGIYQNETESKVTKLIEKFYETKPFPNYKKNDNKSTILKAGDINFIAKRIKEKFRFNKNILEVGAGTCQLSNYLAIGTNNKIFALDATIDSLRLGKKFADENSIKNISFIKADLFEDLFVDNFFDLVWCSGVLHHTKDPYGGFKNIQKYIKKDGYIIIGLYNKIFRIKTVIRQFLYKFFGKKLVMKLDPHLRKVKNEDEKIDAWINDQYEHPVESMHTFDEVLKWFDLNDIEFINSVPSMGSFNMHEIFKKSKRGDKFSRIITQFFSIFSPLANEGGLFIVIGKKK